MEQNIPHQLVIRNKNGVYLCNMLAKTDEEMQLINQDGNVQLIVLENHIIMFNKQSIKLHDYKQQIKELEFTNLQNIHLTESKQHLIIIDKLDQQSFQLQILMFPSLEQKGINFNIKSFKREAWPLLKYSSDDQYYFMIQNQKLHCYADNKCVYQTDIGNCDYFSVQPNTPKPLVVCYSLMDFNIKESFLKIVDINGKIKYEKKLHQTSDLEVIWSPNGQSLLINKGFHEDNTNKSYFGQNQVLFYDFPKNALRELPTYEGPIHHVQWSPSSKEFILLSGFMPSGAVMYDNTCKPLFEFGKDHKNKIIWGNGRFVMICGFGNLDGSIHIWDAKTLKQISNSKYKSASLCHWSPCSRYYVCAKVTPRMNVDNQYSLFDYHGKEIINRKFLELYDVQFRPSNIKFEERPPTPIKQVQQEPPKKQFIAFADNPLAQQMRAMKAGEGARVLQVDETFGKQSNNNYPPGYEPPKEKKKRVRKPKQQQQQQ
ncbi:unnamed protein product [Paramecium primaurelia]|uniref:Translation initiation factor beta propellor-like domain-containing protein n=1 Tax=Paramecium primaurelia TaxID=5886 RepID=A0A8S1MSU7_PARPR|nr:unnamed protein product [Paramecium primaurelia]